MRLEKEITYCGARAKIECDGLCGKAWGVVNRPRVQLSDNEDDCAFLADSELGNAPEDPGTYEGGHAKPIGAKDPGDINKWCVRQCERSELSERLNQPVQLKNWNRRVYNIPTSDPDNR
jgi:hypothetical protein